MTEETAGLDKLERDVRYRDAMKQIHLAYADDLEARAAGNNLVNASR
jgi:hypothetical protein